MLWSVNMSPNHKFIYFYCSDNRFSSTLLTAISASCLKNFNYLKAYAKHTTRIFSGQSAAIFNYSINDMKHLFFAITLSSISAKNITIREVNFLDEKFLSYCRFIASLYQKNYFQRKWLEFPGLVLPVHHFFVREVLMYVSHAQCIIMKNTWKNTRKMESGLRRLVNLLTHLYLIDARNFFSNVFNSKLDGTVQLHKFNAELCKPNAKLCKINAEFNAKFCKIYVNFNAKFFKIGAQA